MVGTLVRGCRCATSWCDLDLTFDLAVVTLTYKILSGLYLGNRNTFLVPLGTKGGLSGPKRVPRLVFKQHSPGSHRQHNSGCHYQQRRGDEVGLPVCPTMENPVLVHQETGNSQGTSHPRPAKRDSRQAIQTWPDHSNRVVPSPGSVSSYMLLVAPAPGGPVCHQIQQQTPSVCVTGSRPPGLGSGCTQPILGKSGPICLPTSSHLGQSGGEVTGLPLQQDHSDCTRVVQHALVLGSGVRVQSAQPAQSGIPTIQPDPAQESVKPEPTCLAPRATAIKELGFSEAVAARIEAPQRGSTRSVYEAKWTIFTKWCLSNQVYLDRTSDLRQNKELVFVSFKKGFDKDISPATISSWIKQTVILCYELSDQEAHTLHQVKAHDVRALLLRLSSRESTWIRFYQPATGNHIIPSHNFI